jgi:hypothetical protein
MITDTALSTHYARRAVVEVCSGDGLFNEAHSTEGKIEPQQLLMLTKLVAASENECGRTASSKVGLSVCRWV